MKALNSICLILAVAICVLAFPVAAQASEPEDEEEFVTAEYAVLMDADTGQVLYEKRMLEQAPPASITKVMTGLLAMERGDPRDVIAASEEAIRIPGESTAIWLKEGETLTVDQAMYAMMLRSANDAANVLAEYVSVTMDDFALLMNERARELGARNTHFVNASGLPHRSHYTTAYDMALITRAAAQNEAFMGYFGADYYTMDATNIGEERYFTNGQSMLLEESQFYTPYVLGGKVGYTDEARHTMVTVARENGRTLVCVVMGCGRTEKFSDTQALLDYGFDEFSPVTVIGPQTQLEPVPYLEDGEIAGEAAWPLTENQWTLLLPRGYDATDIAVEYQIPRELHQGRESEARVVVQPVRQDDSLPSFLLDIPLEARIDRLQPAMGPAADPPPKHDIRFLYSLERTTLIAVGAAAASLLVLIVLLVVMAQRKKRRRWPRHKKYRYDSW